MASDDDAADAALSDEIDAPTNEGRRSVNVPAFTRLEEEWITCGEQLLDGSFVIDASAGSGREATMLMPSGGGRAWYDQAAQRSHGELETLITGATPSELVACLMDLERNPDVTALSTWQEQSNRKRFGKARQMARVGRHIRVCSTHEVGYGAPDLTFTNAVMAKQVADHPLTYIWVMIPIDVGGNFWESTGRNGPASAPWEGPDEAQLTGQGRTPGRLTRVASRLRMSKMKRGKAVQPRAMRCCRLTAVAASEDRRSSGKAVTKFEYAGWLELNEKVLPEWFRLQVIVPEQLATPHAVLYKFDGSFVASKLMDIALAGDAGMQASLVARFVMENRLLRDCVFRHLGALLGALIKGHAMVNLVSLTRVHSERARKASARDLSTITEGEAVAMGFTFQLLLLTASNPADAVETYFTRYPFLREVDAFCPWFEPMMETMAKRLMISSRMGMSVRVTIGAVLSMLDVGSDMYMVLSLFAVGRRSAAIGTLAMILATVLLQVIVTVVQWKHRGRRKVAFEVGIVLSFFKPLIDAYRVAIGDPGDPFAPWTPAQELMVCRIVEMAAEAIPISLLQTTTYLLMPEEERQLAAMLSILISCMATAFTTAMMAYEMDTDPSKRRSLSSFYGWIPSHGSGRVATLLLLMAFHTGVVLGRVFGMSMLAATNWVWLVAYVCADLGLHVFVKAAVLRDLPYFVRGTGFGISLLVRVIQKVTRRANAVDLPSNSQQ